MGGGEVKRALLSHFHVGDARPRPVHLQAECHETQREHVGVRHLRRADPLQSVERVEPYGLPVVEMVVPRRSPHQMPLEGEASGARRAQRGSRARNLRRRQRFSVQGQKQALDAAVGQVTLAVEVPHEQLADFHCTPPVDVYAVNNAGTVALAVPAGCGST